MNPCQACLAFNAAHRSKDKHRASETATVVVLVMVKIMGFEEVVADLCERHSALFAHLLESQPFVNVAGQVFRKSET